jgi:hypothetical protein
MMPGENVDILQHAEEDEPYKAAPRTNSGCVRPEQAGFKMLARSSRACILVIEKHFPHTGQWYLVL